MEETIILVRHTGIYVKVLSLCLIDIFTFHFLYFGRSVCCGQTLPDFVSRRDSVGQTRGGRGGQEHGTLHGTRHTAQHSTRHTALYTARHTADRHEQLGRTDTHLYYTVVHCSALGSTPSGLFIELGQTDTLQFAAQTFSL